MTDIVKRLRELALCRHSDISIGDEAADEIERLRAALRKTYTILLHASLYRGYEGGPLDEPSTAHAVREAKLALEDKKDGD